MPNTVIQLKKSSTPGSTPLPANLANGELAINFADGKLFYKNTAGFISEISGAGGGGGNYFGTVNANNTLVVADATSDILTLEPGTNISIVGDAINDKITIGLRDDVLIPSTGTFKVATVGGDEGGEIRLGNAITNSVLTGDIVIDVYQNRLRFFESGGTNRGAFINLASASAGVATDLLAAATSTDTVARNAASAAFDKANSANILAFNTGVGANAFTSSTISGANTAVGAGANAFASATIAGANAAIGTGANAYAAIVGTSANAFASATIAGANTAVGTGANAFTSATIAGANTAVGAGANAYANLVWSRSNTYADTVGAGANAFTSSTIAGANAAVGLGANTYANATFVRLTSTNQTITGNLAITGSLTVSGNTYKIDANTLVVQDPLIYLAGNNYSSDIVDIGFIANYVNATGANVHTGLYREHTDKMYYLFQGYDREPDNNHIGALSNNMTLAVLNADLRTSNLSLGGTNAITWITASFDRANAANLLAFNTGVGANAFTSATIAGANAAVGAGANAFASVVGTSANAFTSSTIAGANAAVGAGANTVGVAAFIQANTARNQANAAFVKANTSSGGAYYSGNNGDVGNVTGLGDIFRVHTNTLNSNVTIYSGNNALAAGPITVAVNRTLTIQANARVAIV